MYGELQPSGQVSAPAAWRRGAPYSDCDGPGRGRHDAHDPQPPVHQVCRFVRYRGERGVLSRHFEVYFYYQEHKAALIRIQREQAEAASAKISQFIKEIESQLGWTTQLPWSASSIEQRRFDALRLLRQVPAITELAQVDSTGKERLRVSRLAMDVVGSGIDFSKEPKFTEAAANKIYYGPVYFRRESEPYMTLSLAGTRRDAGVSIAEVNLKLIWDVVSQIKVGEKGSAYVIDRQGRLIAHPDISLVLRNTDMSRLPQVRAARQNNPNDPDDDLQVAQNIQGREVLTASAPIEPLGWRMFVELPVEEAYASLYEALYRLVYVLLAALIFAGLAGRVPGAPHGRPDPGAAGRRGAHRRRRFHATHLDQDRRRTRGLGQSVQRHGRPLQDSYADLEKKVEQRTSELAQSVGELRALGEVSQAVNSTLDLEQVLSTIVAKATQLSNTEAGAIYVFDEVQQEFRLRATYGMSDEMIAAVRDQHISISEAVGEATERGEPIQIRPEQRAAVTDQ